ncbi:hypothetical protein VNO77_17817 [Canavalia gladiata]|uniref:Uncharacterized protein n=1 Tax=Canavalia gladiata TaxID=3824 RepID=A0AAN9LNG8_CANGL
MAPHHITMEVRSAQKLFSAVSRTRSKLPDEIALEKQHAAVHDKLDFMISLKLPMGFFLNGYNAKAKTLRLHATLQEPLSPERAHYIRLLRSYPAAASGFLLNHQISNS